MTGRQGSKLWYAQHTVHTILPALTLERNEIFAQRERQRDNKTSTHTRKKANQEWNKG